jgi:hypothetical protein
MQHCFFFFFFSSKASLSLSRFLYYSVCVSMDISMALSQSTLSHISCLSIPSKNFPYHYFFFLSLSLSLSLSLLTPSFLSIWKSFWEEKVFVCEKDGKRVGHLNSFFHYFSSATYFGLELPPIFLTSPPCRPFRKKNTREGPSKWNCWQRFLLARLMRNFWRKLFSL